jgi:hypothetical protein
VAFDIFSARSDDTPCNNGGRKNTANMPSKLMMVFVSMDVLFALCGGLLMGFSLISEQGLRANPTIANVAQNLLLDQCPLTGTAPPCGS